MFILYTTNLFIQKAIEKHGDKYDYSLVDYKRASIKIKIICKKHGAFEQRPTQHIQGAGCPLCHKERLKYGTKGAGRKPIKGKDKKMCPICKRVLKRTEKFFGRNSVISDGLHSYCKKCVKKINKDQHLKNKDKMKLVNHINYLRQKASGKRRQYKINRLIKEGRLPIKTT